jgi:hypothetical protein
LAALMLSGIVVVATGCPGAGLPLGFAVVGSAFSATPKLVHADVPVGSRHAARQHEARATYAVGANRALAPLNLISAVTLGLVPTTTVLGAEDGSTFVHEEWLPLWFPYHSCCITVSFPFDVGFPDDEALAATLRLVGNGEPGDDTDLLGNLSGAVDSGGCSASPLACLLGNQSPRVRAEAAAALSRRAKRGLEPAEPLCDHAADPDARVRLAVEQAILATRPGCAGPLDRPEWHLEVAPDPSGEEPPR